MRRRTSSKQTTLKPSAFFLIHGAEYGFGIEQFASLRRSVAFADLGIYLGGVLRKPGLLFMKQNDGPFDKFVGGLVGAALHVLFNEFF